MERWAWELAMGPPPPPTFVDQHGNELEPYVVELPGVPWWGYFAERLPAVVSENPTRPPDALLRAVGAPWTPRKG